MATTFTVIIPVKALNDFLLESLPVLFQLQSPSPEIWILPNDYKNRPFGNPVPLSVLEQDKYFKNIKGWEKAKKNIRIVPTGNVGPADKRDLAASKTHGTVLAFLDDDAFPKTNWLHIAKIYFEKGHDALGGPGITPPHVSLRELSSGAVFETFFGGGNTRDRYRPGKKSYFCDDYPTVNFLVRRKLFLKVGGFDNSYWPGEDTKFCLDFIQAGFKILYVPELVVWHHRRPLFFPHLKQIGNYGRHRGFFAKTHPQTSLRPTYLLPSAFLLGLLLGWIPACWIKELIWIYLGILFFYFLAAFIDSFRVTSHFRRAVLTTLGIFLTHLVYGFQFLRGLFAKKFRSQLR